MKKILAILAVLAVLGGGAGAVYYYFLRPEDQGPTKMTLEVSGEITAVENGVMTVVTEQGNEYKMAFAASDRPESPAEPEDKITAHCEYRSDDPGTLEVTSHTLVKPVLIEVKLHGNVTAVDGSIVTLKDDTLNADVRVDITGVSNLPKDLAAEDELHVEAQYWDNKADLPWTAVTVVRVEKPAPVTYEIVDDEKPNPNALKDGDVTSKGFTVRVIDGVTYIDGVLIANKTYRLPATYNPGGLTRECKNAFNAMKEGAAEAGYKLKIVSGFRDFETQYVIYWRYVNRDGQKAADTYSARPGHSEHQSGLAMDINSLKSSWGDTEEGKWLAAHCHEYGFIIRYPKGKSGITGYIYEPWHARYVGVELATKLYESGLTLEEYFGIDSEYYE